MKIIVNLFVPGLMLLGAFACQEQQELAVTGISVSPTEISLKVGETYTLECTVVPSDAANKDVEWSSGDETVATVNTDGLVTAVSEGSTNVTVTTLDGSFTANCSVSVTAGETDQDEESSVTDLSASATANCYLISGSGQYRFDATTMGNGASVEGIVPGELGPASAELLWQSAIGMINEVSYADGYIMFTADGSAGNALIAALDDEGTIIWSWHIWLPEESVGSMTTKTGYEIMNMNLGALCSDFPDSGDEEVTGGKVYGLLYQWGRKDPFPASSTLTGDTSTLGGPIYDANGNQIYISQSSYSSTADNTIEYSIANPTVCISNYAHYSTNRDWLASGEGNDALWGNPNGLDKDDDNNYVNKGSKTIYDPCPEGWMVPPIDVFRNAAPNGNISYTISDWDIEDINGDGVLDKNDFRYGWYLNMEEGSGLFPAAARYDGTYAMLYGSVSGLWGNYWSNSPGSSSSYYSGMGGSCLAFSYDQGMLSPNASGSKADAYSIRCVRE